MLSYYILANYPIKEALEYLKYVQGLYYLMIFLGGLISWILIYKRLLTWDQEKRKIHIFMFISGGAGILSIILGSRILRMFYLPSNSWSIDLLINEIKSGRIETFHGSLFAFLFIMVVIIFISNRLKFLQLKYSEVIDVGALYMPLHIFFGRTGCFLAGCCWGREGQITISGDTYAFNHPAPFYEMMYGLTVFFILRFIYNKIYFSDKKQIYSGIVTAIAAISYGVFRFLIEYIRREPLLEAGLTQAQIAMIIQTTFGIGVILYVLFKRYRFQK
jgi:phosphatidylglycerol:prolipoprotein diacylglycerol transferase